MSNLTFGWISLVAGAATGAILGLWFQRPNFLGGYDSYRRRLVRLGHIAFFGLGFVNILFGLSRTYMQLSTSEMAAASVALMIGNVTMPLACGMAAWRPGFKPLFVVPVATVIYGAIGAVTGLLRAGH